MTTPCDEWELLVQADLDGELDIAATARLARHLETCPACAALQTDLLALSARIKTEVNQELTPAALTALVRVPGHRRWPPLFGSFSAGAALAASLAWFLLVPLPDPNGELIAGHIRALQPGHLTDVISTDSHTVKPWFDGRIDYAPDVRDFAAAGFALTGGRLDYVGGRTVSALVYQHAKHVIDLYQWPATGANAPSVGTAKGYTVVRWTGAGMAYVAVSDITPDDLLGFVRLWQP